MRTVDELRSVGVAWCTEAEFSWLCDRARALEKNEARQSEAAAELKAIALSGGIPLAAIGRLQLLAVALSSAPSSGRSREVGT